MTANKNFKRRVRARAAKTGESYTAALRHFRVAPNGGVMSTRPPTIRIAVAQHRVGDDPRDREQIERSGKEVRRLLCEAADLGARLVHFPEGALCAPAKRILSSASDGTLQPFDWSTACWDQLRRELQLVADLAAEQRLWVVLGSVHQLTPPNRPHNSLYVIADDGHVVTRYDERMLSSTKVSYLYAPGSMPVTFEVDGFRFGCSTGMEVHFPEVFLEYERLDVDAVVFSTTGSTVPSETAFAVEAAAHAATNRYWVSYAATAGDGAGPSGVVSPDGSWAARCLGNETPEVVVADIDRGAGDLARPWRRTARSGIYAPHLVQDDPRSDDRARV